MEIFPLLINVVADAERFALTVTEEQTDGERVLLRVYVAEVAEGEGPVNGGV